MATEIAIIQTPLTKMALSFETEVLVAVDFFTQKNLLPPRSDMAKETCRQIEDYCAKQLNNLEFNIETLSKGTPFQKKVWQSLENIPVGKTMTYGELARQLNTSARAVGNACRANPIPLVIPCHRVVSKSGMGGYAGSRDGMPMKIKRWLLEHEGVSL